MRRQKPVFSICAEHLRPAHVRGAAGRSRLCHLNFLQTPRRGLPLACKPGRPLFYLAKGGSFFMKTNPRSTTRSLVLAALFLALAFVLPMITGSGAR